MVEIFVHGEIYNHQDLYRQLRLDYPLKPCLEEIVFYTLLKWNRKGISKLEGPFTIIIKQKDTVYVIRDPLGLVPTYYSYYQNYLYVSDQVEGILTTSNQNFVVGQQQLLDLFAFGPSIPESHTLCKNVYELPMASYLQFRNGNITVTQYYKLPIYQHKDDELTTIKTVRSLLDHSIHQQYKNCHASFLSGGIDSSVITATCSNDSHVRTYSLDYQDNDKYAVATQFLPSLDHPYIESMVTNYQTEHTFLTIQQQTIVNTLKTAMLAQQKPGMADIDASFLWLCQKVKSKEDCILSGECSDEIFGGYPWFYQTTLQQTPNFPWLRYQDEKIELLNNKFQSIDYAGYVQQEYDSSISKCTFLSMNEDDDQYRKYSYLCLHWFMQTLIKRQYSISQATNLTIRNPFANVALMEYVYNIPWNLQFKNHTEKYILRNAYKKELPLSILNRKKSPYPKTQNPQYNRLVCDLLKKSYDNENSILHLLFDDQKLRLLIDSNGSSFLLPWYGQLMSGPQLLGYIYQIEQWFKHYNIKIVY